MPNIRLIFPDITSGSALDLSYFFGYCRYDSSAYFNYDGTRAGSDLDCYEECKAATKCTAFAYDYETSENNCHFYAGGPYTSGNGRSGTRCYDIKQGKTSC